MVSSRNTTITAIRILYLLLLCVLQAQVRLCFAAKVWLLLPHFICLRNLWIFFPLISFYWVHMKVYVVYMGSRGSDDPDEILRQNHQILTDIHGGRFKIKTHFSFPPFFYSFGSFESKPRFSQFSSCCFDAIVVFLLFLLFFFVCADSKSFYWFCLQWWRGQGIPCVQLQTWVQRICSQIDWGPSFWNG